MVELSPVRFPLLHSRVVLFAISALVVLAVVVAWTLEISLVKAAVFSLLSIGVAVATLLGAVPGVLAVTAAALIFELLFASSMFTGVIGFAAVFASTYGIKRWVVRSGRDQKLKLLSFRFRNRIHAGRERAAGARRELGRLDGCRDGELFGWALDANDESRASKVALYIDGRPHAEALAVHYRPDVGSHCFYFDLTTLHIESQPASADVRFIDGRLLTNAPLSVHVPAIPSRRKEALLFLHISKTAGTAFREALAENYRQCEIAYVYPDVPGMLCRNLNELPLEQRRGFRLVAGHFQYGIHNFFPQEYTYVTIVREPIARIISEHRYLREKTSDKPEQGAAASLIAMLERGEHTNLDNLLVRCFSGVNEAELPAGAVDQDTYQLALENLHTGFHLVGHQERLAAAYEALRERFDWKPRAAFEAVNTTRVGTIEEYAAARSAIEHFNRWDLRLYEEILRLYPLS